MQEALQEGSVVFLRQRLLAPLHEVSDATASAFERVLEQPIMEELEALRADLWGARTAASKYETTLVEATESV